MREGGKLTAAASFARTLCLILTLPVYYFPDPDRRQNSSLLFYAACEEDQDDVKLPPMTMEGKNTFGCLVNGQVWLPKGTLGQPGLVAEIASDRWVWVGADDTVDCKGDCLIRVVRRNNKRNLCHGTRPIT